MGVFRGRDEQRSDTDRQTGERNKWRNGILDCLPEGPERDDRKRCVGSRAQSRIERRESGGIFGDAHSIEVRGSCHATIATNTNGLRNSSSEFEPANLRFPL